MGHVAERREPGSRRERSPKELRRLARRHAALAREPRRAAADAPAASPISKVLGAKLPRTEARVANEGTAAEALDAMGAKVVAELFAVAGEVDSVVAKLAANKPAVEPAVVVPASDLTLKAVVRLALDKALAMLALDPRLASLDTIDALFLDVAHVALLGLLNPRRLAAVAMAAILESERPPLDIAGGTAAPALDIAGETAAPMFNVAGLGVAAAVADLRSGSLCTAATAGLNFAAPIAALGGMLIATTMTAAGLSAGRHRNRQRSDPRGKK